MITIRNNYSGVILLHPDNDRLCIQQRINLFAVDDSP